VVKGILPKYRKEGMIELLNWRDKGFFGKKENISIHELADKGAEWGLFLSDSNTISQDNRNRIGRNLER